MRVGIVQSNYIPWRGYFDFIDDVDLFVYFDDTQYTRRDWRNRNKIKTQNGLKWLTVPVNDKYGERMIDETPIDYTQNWATKHLNAITQNYKSAPFFERYKDRFFELIQTKHDALSDLNREINAWLMDELSITTPIRLSSEFGKTGAKSDRLLDILKQVGATHYLSGPKAMAYLETDKFHEASITLELKEYAYAPYPQMFGDFEPYVSVLDLLFNCGPESRKFLKSRTPNTIVK